MEMIKVKMVAESLHESMLNGSYGTMRLSKDYDMTYEFDGKCELELRRLYGGGACSVINRLDFGIGAGGKYITTEVVEHYVRKLLKDIISSSEEPVMRKIKFRGKPIEPMSGKEWVYGSLIANYKDNLFYIVEDTSTEIVSIRVVPESVGQHTGLEEIYEGDIYENYLGKYIVKHAGGGFYLHDPSEDDIESEEHCNLEMTISMEEYRGKVIGNVYDNKELLSKRKN